MKKNKNTGEVVVSVVFRGREAECLENYKTDCGIRSNAAACRMAVMKLANAPETKGMNKENKDE